MSNFLNNRAILVVGIFSLLLSACSSTVPQPTMSLENTKSPTPVFSMHNIGPQHRFESRAIHFADLNQDGHIDLLVGGRGSVDSFQVGWGDGAGHWQMQSGPFTSMQPRSFAVADVDADSALEILIGGEGDQKGLQIWSLDADSGSWSLHSSPVEGGIYHAVKFSDLNHDGWPDIIAARAGSERDGGIQVLLNNGQGGWQTGTGPIVAGVFTGLAIADMNGDGNPDIVASRRGGLGAQVDKDEQWRQVGGVQIWYGDGSGRWEPEVLAVDADAESVAVADVNGDGNLDVIAGLYQQGICLWLGSNSRKKQSVVQEGTWSDLKVGDLDGDGRRELVATSNDGRGIAVWSWRSGSFSSRTKTVPDYGVYFSLDLGDVYNRGQLDIAAVRADGGSEVWSGLKAKPAPKREIRGEAVGEELAVYFDSGLASMNETSQQSIEAWVSKFDMPLAQTRFELQGRADIRAVHSDLYPNNAALSQARAEAVAAWLVSRGVRREAVTIESVGDTDPLPQGNDPVALQQNRSVSVQAYAIESVRLPEIIHSKARDLYHVDENRVFKVIDGVPGYKIGPGDELSMVFWQGGKSEEHKVTVQVDGTVSLPYQEALEVSGLTPREVDKYVTALLSRYEKRPRVDVQVLKARSKTANIFGEVQSLTRQPTGPGSYFMSGKESLVDLLSRAGGPGKDADLSNVQITRDGKTITLDLKRAIKQGDWTENAIIDHGDTIFIPSLAQSKHRVYVLGAVGKPGVVEFNGDMTFLDAVLKSGGLDKGASLPDIRVLRSDRDAPQILAVDFERFMERGDLTQNIALQDNDVLIVPRRPIANWNLYVQDLLPSIQLILAPMSIASQSLSIAVLSKQL